MNPWMNQPLALWRGDPRAQMMLDWAAGRLDQDAAERFVAAQPQRRSPQGSGGVGVVSLQGVIMRHPGIIETLMGATSLDAFVQSFRGAMADPNISTILLLIDSPGGEVAGLPEAAAEIRAARGQKRIVTFADMAASAAFWLGSQADELVVTPSGVVGAIEVYQIHTDVSGALEQAGIKREVIAGGPNRQHGAEGFPLTEEDRAHVQAMADELYAMEASDIAKARGVSVKDVTDGYGKGRPVLAKQAKAAGMVDRIDTLDGVLRREIGSRQGRTVTAAEMLGPGWEALGEVHDGHDGPMIGHEIAEGEEGLLVVDDPALPEAPPIVEGPPLVFELELRRRRAALR